MIRNRVLRRGMAAGLIVIGALLLWLAPESVAGLVAFVLGVALELLGLAVERRGPGR